MQLPSGAECDCSKSTHTAQTSWKHMYNTYEHTYMQYTHVCMYKVCIYIWLTIVVYSCGCVCNMIFNTVKHLLYVCKCSHVYMHVHTHEYVDRHTHTYVFTQYVWMRLKVLVWVPRSTHTPIRVQFTCPYSALVWWQTVTGLTHVQYNNNQMLQAGSECVCHTAMALIPPAHPLMSRSLTQFGRTARNRLTPLEHPWYKVGRQVGERSRKGHTKRLLAAVRDPQETLT